MLFQLIQITCKVAHLNIIYSKSCLKAFEFLFLQYISFVYNLESAETNIEEAQYDLVLFTIFISSNNNKTLYVGGCVQ